MAVFSWNNRYTFHCILGTWQVPGRRMWWGSCLLCTCCLPSKEGIALWIKHLGSDASYDSPAAQEEIVVCLLQMLLSVLPLWRKDRNGVTGMKGHRNVAFCDLYLLCKCCTPGILDRNSSLGITKTVVMGMRRFLPLDCSFSVCFNLI